MSDTAIAFPHLGIYLEYVPKNFTVFGFTIALYGVVIACGIGAGIWIATKNAGKYGYNAELIWDFIIYGIIFGVIGARIYYVAFSWDNYKNDLLSIFNTRNGGMAIYGSVIAATLTLFIFCRKKKLSFFMMTDMCVPGLALGQAIGRFGNFFNREAFGEYTDGLLAMRLPVAAVRPHEITEKIAAHIGDANYIQVHPTFLYECLWNIALVAVLLLIWKYKKFEGEAALVYFGGYGLGRSVIEAFRTDQLLWPGTHIPVSQMLAVILVVASAAGFVVMMRKTRVSNLTDTQSHEIHTH